MQAYEDIQSGMIVYSAKEEDFWNDESDSPNPDGKLSQYTRMKIVSHDEEFLKLEILEGEYVGKRQAVFWWGEGSAKPEDYLTQEEYNLIRGEFEVSKCNVNDVIIEIENALSGVVKQKFEKLIEYLNK